MPRTDIQSAPPQAAFLAQLIGDMLPHGRRDGFFCAANSKKGAARGNALKIDRLV